MFSRIFDTWEMRGRKRAPPPRRGRGCKLVHAHLYIVLRMRKNHTGVVITLIHA